MWEPMTGRSVWVAGVIAALCLGLHPVGEAWGKAVPAAPGRGALVQAPVRAACAPATEEMIGAGHKIFTGDGNCYTCHGADAKGTALAPSLHEHKWLNIDGSYAAIAELVTTGVPHPKEHPAPMPPKGGANLNERQVCEVAAYVYSLSHPK